MTALPICDRNFYCTCLLIEKAERTSSIQHNRHLAPGFG